MNYEGTSNLSKDEAWYNASKQAFDNQLIYITENGSYILSNGIIVLIDEDIKAYFDGTLVFHKKDEEIE